SGRRWAAARGHDRPGGPAGAPRGAPPADGASVARGRRAEPTVSAAGAGRDAAGPRPGAAVASRGRALGSGLEAAGPGGGSARRLMLVSASRAGAAAPPA